MVSILETIFLEVYDEKSLLFHPNFTLILSRDRRLEKIESKDGWAVADKIDHFFNEVDVVGFVSSGVVHVVGLVQCPCCYCWW